MMPKKTTQFFNSPKLHGIAKVALARIPAERGDRVGGQSDGLVAVVFAALAVEAFANELGMLASDEFYWDGRTSPDPSAVAKAYADVEATHGSVLDKLQAFRQVLADARWPTGCGIFQDVADLLRLRNELVHLKLDIREGDTASADAGEPPKIVGQLRSKRILADDQQPSAETWTSTVSTWAAGAWACNVAAGIVAETLSLLPPGELRADAEHYLGRAITGVGRRSPTRG